MASFFPLRSTRPWGRALVFSLAVVAAAAQAQTVLPEVQVSTANIPDFEFDTGRNGVFCATCNFGTGNARFSFADPAGQLWLGYVDFNTGAFLPQDGHAVLIDSNVAKPTDFGNGPEWISSVNGSQLTYTKYLPGVPASPASATLALATMVNGSWSPTTLPNSTGRVSPAGTLDATDTDPRINYAKSDDNSKFYWRSLSSPGVEHAMPSKRTDGAGRRWVSGTRKIIYQSQPAGSTNLLIDQIFLYDTDTGTSEQLTFDPIAKVSAFMWRAPEFNNEYVFFTMADMRRQILVYRKLAGADGVLRWTVAKVIQAPTQLPYFWSPEVFTHNGRSYIFMQVSAAMAFYDRTVPNQLAITGIDPARQDFRMLTNNSQTPRLRLDPEYFITSQGPFVYYNRAVPETASHGAVNDGVWRVDTRLGPTIPR